MSIKTYFLSLLMLLALTTLGMAQTANPFAGDLDRPHSAWDSEDAEEEMSGGEDDDEGEELC